MRLIYVDDDPDLRDIAEWALMQRSDFDVRLLPSGEAALALVDRGDWIPDLVVLDAKMPGLDGPATLAALRLRPALAETRFAFVSAARGAEREALEQCRVDAVLKKPFDPATFADTLAEIAGGTPGAAEAGT